MTIERAKELAELVRRYNTMTKKTVPEARFELLTAIDNGELDSVKDLAFPNRYYLFDDGNKRSAWITRVNAVEPKTVRDDKAIAKAFADAHDGKTPADYAADWYAEHYGDVPTTTTSGKSATVQCEHPTSKK